MHPFRLLIVTTAITAAAAAAVVGLADVLGPAVMLTVLAFVITIASAVHHHRLFLAMDAAADVPGASQRSYLWALALPYVVSAGLIVGSAPIASVMLLMAAVAGTGSGGIGSVSAGLSEALVEVVLVLVVLVVPVVLLLTRYVRRSTNRRDSQ
jgi:hypothetical protein